MCIHAFRQTIEYYKQNSSPVFICYMDATKAFDRVNHWLLFKKLLDRNMPLHIVRLLACRYRTQRFNVQWGGCSSKCFSAANGVPQGQPRARRGPRAGSGPRHYFVRPARGS